MSAITLGRSAVAAAVVLAVAGFIPYHFHATREAQAEIVPPASSETVTGLPDFTGLVQQAAPAVVSVHISQMVHTGFDGMPPGMDPDNPLLQFFRQFGAPNGKFYFYGPQNGGEKKITGEGSGFIVNPDGYILTNAHVVDGADHVTVELNDNRSLNAKVIGVDKKSDIAVLKVNAHNLPTLKIGDSDQLKVGQWVVAIGSPFGLEHTVTAGIVSAKSRTLDDGGYVPFIQTDVPINPGNSGGPLLNMKGEVVGINSQIYSRSGGYMGLSFSIPVNFAMNIENQLVEHGKVTRGRLGVSVQSINQDLADSFGLKSPQGALVNQVQDDTPASRAGIKQGDIITSVDGKAVTDSAELARTIAGIEPGKSAEIHVLRNGEDKELNVKIGTMPSDQALASNDNGSAGADSGRLGVVVSPVNGDDGDRGLLVQEASGAAADSGIRPGDVILAVNSKPVTTPDQLRHLIGKAGKHIALLVKRKDMEVYVPVDLG